MGALTGADLWLRFGSTNLHTNYRSFSPTETGGIIDASAGADTERTYLTTLKDGTATATIVVQADGTTEWAAVAPLTSATLWWAEEGSASSGTQQHTVWAIVTERRKTMGYADLIIADISWQFSGTVSDI